MLVGLHKKGGYTMSVRSMLMVAMTVSVVAFSLPAPAAAAAKKTCSKRGYSVDLKTQSNFLMRKAVRDKSSWSGTAYDYYVCSRSHRVRVGIGTYGISWDGQIDFTGLTMNSNFAAYFSGTSDNAGGVEFTDLDIRNLRTRKRRNLSLSSTGAGGVPLATAISEQGDFAWIDVGNKVFFASRIPGSPVQLLAQGQEIDPNFLKFTNIDGKQVLVWSTASSSHTAP